MIIFRRIQFLLVLLLAGTSSIGQTGYINKSFSMSDACKPSGLCWDGANLWMIDYASDMINKINPENGEIILSFATPDQMSTGLAWDGTHLWCSGNRSNKVYQLSPSGEILKSIWITSEPRGITFVNGSLWFADSKKRHIYKFDTDTEEYLDTIQAPGGSSRGLAFDGKYLWCSDIGLKEIYKIDIAHKKIIMIIPAPFDYPYGLTWDGNMLWIAGFNSAGLKQMLTTGAEAYYYTDSLEAHVKYRLMVKNTGSTVMNLRTWICRPQPSGRQKFESGPVFSPYPLTFTSDQWDQQFAYYNDAVSQNDSVVYCMDADVTTYDLRYNILPDEVGTIADVPAPIQSSYMSDGQYYDIHNQVITDAVAEAIGDETNMYWKARMIHDYIISKIHYDLDGRWDEAPQILTRGTGSCSEYSYLLISMCRAAHIPARFEAGGYYGGGMPYVDQVFHRWSQIYLPPYGWMQVDATWDDRDYPANQSRYFCATSKKVFATTVGSGGSNKISWTYNSANSNNGGIRERDRKFIWSPKGSSAVEALPAAYVQLHQNFPNPFADHTTISFSLAKPAKLTINIINLQGVKVSEILSEPFDQGDHLITWHRNNQPPGVYFIQLITDQEIHSTTCIITR